MTEHPKRKALSKIGTTSSLHTFRAAANSQRMKPKSTRKSRRNEQQRMFNQLKDYRTENQKDQVYRTQQIRAKEKRRILSGLPINPIFKPLSRIGRSTQPLQTITDDFLLKSIKARSTRKRPETAQTARPQRQLSLSLLDRGKNKTQEPSEVLLSTLYPKSFMAPKEYKSLPCYLQKGTRIIRTSSLPTPENTKYNEDWQERNKITRFDLNRKKAAKLKLNYTVKFGSSNSFDRQNLNKAVAKIQLELKILELKDDGLAEHAGEHDDGEGSVRQKATNAYRTAPAYVKQKVHSQRNSLDVLLQSTKQTLELMELGITPSSLCSNDNGTVYHSNKLLKKVQHACKYHRQRSVAFMHRHLEQIKIKKKLYQDPALFYLRQDGGMVELAKRGK
jgi:hypothetical protein